MKLFLALSTFLFPITVFTKPALSELKPLYFQADKNNIQVLPQRFEYALLEDGSIRIGDVKIDQNKLNFQISDQGDKNYQLTFQWPSGLLREGNLIIKNSIGKAILNKRILKDLSTSQGTDNAEYTVSITTDQVEDMKYSPFMTFCVFREDSETRIYLCSQELFLSHQSGPLTIKPRSEIKKNTQVEVNGQIVGNQGYIFLNNANEKIYFKATVQNGANLEIETRRKDVDLKDIVISEDGKSLLLTASGAEPANNTIVTNISSADWQIKLDASRPYFYVKGNGDIPMRQELLVKGPLPTENDRTYIKADARTRTYGSKISFEIYPPDHTSLRPLGKGSKVDGETQEHLRWTIDNIPTATNVRRYIAYKKGSKQIIAGQDIFRGTPFELGVYAAHFNPSSIAYLGLNFQWWLGIGAMHWGLKLEHRMPLTTEIGESKVNLTTGELLYRLTPGFYLADETWGTSLSYQLIKTDLFSLSMPGLGLFTHQKGSDQWINWLSWYQLHLKYFLDSSGKTVKIKQAYLASWTAYRPMNDSTSMSYGLELQQFKFQPAATSEKMQIGFNLGLSYVF